MKEPNKEIWLKVALLINECEELRINAEPNYPNYFAFWLLNIACMVNRLFRKENPIRIFILGEERYSFNVSRCLEHAIQV